MSQQEQKEFQEYLKTLCPWDREWALDMASRGTRWRKSSTISSSKQRPNNF